MVRSQNRSANIGRFIRQQVIPPGMTVTEAAKRLGVGRPALSNLLNGRAALSPNMALRLEETLGADRARLLDLQAASDRERRNVEDRTVAVGTYAPSFFTIEARQIDQWAAGNIRARDRLPVLLRRLIHAGRREPQRVDFSGYDNAQRPGWDGWVESDSATSWVPEGRSGWELSGDARPRAKAERDYRARLKMLSPAERADCTFVFVTSRNWAGKVEWERGKAAAEDWKAVRALDASDLEQWLEETTAPRIWLAHELDIPTKGFETLDHFWERWAAASAPPMSAQIFAPAVAAHRDDFQKWIEKTPDRPLTVAADSREEAVAFVACLLRSGDALAHHRARAVVFGSARESANALRTLAPSSSPFIPIVYSPDAEREVATLYRRRHCIVVRPRNAVHREPDVTVDLLGHEAFEKALADMGVEPERIVSLARESGRSPTVLRRRLSPIGAISTPPWAGDQAVARRLISMTLVGAWHKESPADREVLAALADRPYEEVEKDVADLLQRDDCPVWRVDQYRGVVSKLDALFAIRPWMTERDITDFVDFAEYVLSESDPALELPDDQRWAAGLYGKVREHSSALRNGVCETLVLLAVHGAALLRNGLSIDPAALVAALVERLLSPLTSDNLRSQDRDLPGYAEAAPDQFLALIEADLRKSEPALEGLLTPVGHGPFEHPWRTGLLWALERLAWNPTTFMRVVLVLARLSRTQIDDNWVNKPINSLLAIFRSWLPQTAASVDDRIRAIETVCRRFPDVGWRICIAQFEGGPQVANPNNRPRWRNDAAGAGHGVSGTEMYEFCRKALDLAIAWPTHDKETLGDLVERLGDLPVDDQSLIWDLIDRWSRTETDEKARAALREKIRLTVLSRRGQPSGLEVEQRNRAHEICEELASPDPIRRHAWLFAGAWVEYSGDELDEEDLDLEAREKRIDSHRTDAMTEIWSAHGLDGVLGLLADGDGWTIGRYSARSVVARRAATDVLRSCLSMEVRSPEKLDHFMQGFISCIEEGMRSAVIATVAASATVDRSVRLFRCAPFGNHTWRLLDGQGRRVRDGYWRTVTPAIGRFKEAETTEIVDRFLEAERAPEALFAVRFDWDRVETSRLKKLLRAVIEVSAEQARQYEMRPWDLSKALDSLDGRAGVTVDEMAQLEFAFVDALVLPGGSRRQTHGIPNLERRIAEAPGLFVQAVGLVFRRQDEGQDPPEWRVDDPERFRAAGTAAYRLLDGIRRVPGTDAEGTVDAHALHQWVTEVRRLCRQHGRPRMGDRHIGQFLSRAPSEGEGAWPCQAVCEVLETVASRDVADGFAMAVFNARGVVSRGLEEGGEQERMLSAKYRAWAQHWKFEYPFVAGILGRIADQYAHDAEREDSEVLVVKRLEN